MGKTARSADYDAIADPYCYPGSTVLRNIPDIREPEALAEFEAVSTAQRADEPLPEGRLSVRHYRAIHHHLFQDVYAWAGKFRTVRLGKEGSAFCYPENIAREMQRLFADLRRQGHLKGLSREVFAMAAAHFLATPTLYIRSAKATAVPRPGSWHSSPIAPATHSISIG